MGVSPKIDTFIISFRGSTNIMNWILNIDFFKKVAYKNVPNCKVHSGFYDAYNDLKIPIYQNLQNFSLKYPNISKILVTGHSL